MEQKKDGNNEKKYTEYEYLKKRVKKLIIASILLAVVWILKWLKVF